MRNFYSLFGIVFFFMVVTVHSANAQETQNEDATTETSTEETQNNSQNYQLFQQLAIGVSTGTRGLIGGDLTAKVVDKVNFKLGYNHLTFKLEEYETTLGGATSEDFVMNANLEQSNIEFLVEYELLNGWVRLSMGPVFGFDNNLHADFVLAEAIEFNDITLEPEQLGTIGADLTHNFEIFPYFGIGIGRSISRKKLSFSADIGTYYKGTPEITLDATGLLSSNKQNEKTLNQNLRKENTFNFWPVLSFRLGYRLF